jgi:hypothetical protein
MQKSTSTILVAFLAGIVVAGGTAYVVSSTRHNDTNPPAQQVAHVQAPTVPAAVPPPAAAPEDTAAPQPAPEPVVKPKPAVDEKASARRKRRPGVEQRAEPRPEPQNSEVAAAPQPTHAQQREQAASQDNGDQQTQTQAGQNQAGQNQSNSAGQNGAPQPSAALNPPPGTQTAPPPPRTPQTVTIPAGTLLPVRVNEKISTDNNYSGDAFTATLEKPLVVNGFVIADRGARITGKVVEAVKPGRIKGVADLQLALTKLHTTDGQTIDIVTTPWDKRGPGSKKRDGAEMAGGAALGAIIGAIAGGGKGAAIGAGTGGAAGTGVVLSQRGKAATIPSETRLTFTLDSPVTITERL